MSEKQTVRPAIENLHSEQREFVERCIEGVDTRWEQVELLHDWAVLSAGRVNPDLLVDVGASRTGMYSDVFMGEFENLRAGFVNDRVIPGMNAAHGELWQKATEYGSSAPDPETEEAVAMRPALEELWEDQWAVLRRGAAGFDTHEEAIEWSHDVARVSLGNADDGMLERLTSPSMLKRPLHFSPFDDEHQAIRMLGLVLYVMPWFVEAVREQVVAASEQPDEKEPDLDEYELDEGLVVDDP
jgi:hypothetical protein